MMVGCVLLCCLFKCFIAFALGQLPKLSTAEAMAGEVETCQAALLEAQFDMGLAQAKELMQRCIDSPDCLMTAKQLNLIRVSLLYYKV